MNHIKFIFAFLFAFVTVFSISSCEEDEEATPGPITLHFENRAGNSKLNFGQAYTNAAGESLTFSTFNYFISNIKLKKSDGTYYTVPQAESYFLLDGADEESREITLNNVPGGDYVGFEFVLGVDSVKSASDISERTGDLDPAGAAQGMYWMWNSGYIFVKVEGTSPQVTEADGAFFYHIGGYGGYSSPTINNLKNIALTAHNDEKAGVSKDSHPEVHIYADVLEVFTSPNNLSVAESPMIMFSPESTSVADNYADMFSVNHIHND
ncbi:MAG: hypothetical protein IPM47_01415 [Sphingobacteriales bacterium]|nr:MAG: hypothetical protein IPM47_01415 [Sphingobacteriales bacterium]